MMFNDIEDSNGHGTQVLALRAHDAAHVIAVKVLVSNGSGWRMADTADRGGYNMYTYVLAIL